MTIEVAVYCDDCGSIAASGRTAKDARRDLRAAGGRGPLPGGKDRCHHCERERTPTPGGTDG